MVVGYCDLCIRGQGTGYVQEARALVDGELGRVDGLTVEKEKRKKGCGWNGE